MENLETHEYAEILISRLYEEPPHSHPSPSRPGGGIRPSACRPKRPDFCRWTDRVRQSVCYRKSRRPGDDRDCYGALQHLSKQHRRMGTPVLADRPVRPASPYEHVSVSATSRGGQACQSRGRSPEGGRAGRNSLTILEARTERQLSFRKKTSRISRRRWAGVLRPVAHRQFPARLSGKVPAGSPTMERGGVGNIRPIRANVRRRTRRERWSGPRSNQRSRASSQTASGARESR